MRTLALILAAIATTSCNHDHDGGPATHHDAGDAEAGTGVGGHAATPRGHGDLTGFYNLHVDVVSDTCTPAREVATDLEVLAWGDRSHDAFRLPLPNSNLSGSDDRIFPAQIEVPLEQHTTPDLLVATCPDTTLSIETGPFELSDKHVVSPYTATWHHGDACSNSQVAATGYDPPSSDCALQLVLTFDWSRECPTPRDSFPSDGGSAIYCE